MKYDTDRRLTWPIGAPPRSVRRIVLGLLAVALGAGVAAGLYSISVEPGAAIVKAVFEAKPEVTPPSGFAQIETTVALAKHAQIHAKGAPTAHLDIYTSKNASGVQPVVLWIHGGGFISSSADTVRDYVILLASKGFVVANLDYSLAPGSRYPVPVEQANAALSYLRATALKYGGDSNNIFIGGDSAGAEIAAELGSVQTDPALARELDLRPGAPSKSVRGMILFCGLYDMRTVADTGFPALRTYLWAYTGQRNWTDFRAIDQLSATSTAGGRYPPTFLAVGDKDPLSTQASELASHLRREGVTVATEFWNGTGDGLTHEYQFDFALPQAHATFAATLSFLATNDGRKQ
jgi:acetyl esterase/lipase